MANKKLSDMCKELRWRANYQQQEVAKELKINPTLLSKYENGHIRFPPDIFEKYCELLNLNETQKQELIVLAMADESPPPTPLRSKRIIIVVAMLVIVIGGTVAIIWNIFQPNQPVWQDAFKRRWMPTSAYWEDNDGLRAILRENNSDKDFGKVESEVITVDIDEYPILRINAVTVDPQASYTVQILDKRTGIPKDVLKGITYPGEQIVNLAQEMGWQGEQVFTINIWISGEGKSAEFALVSIEAE